MSLLRSAQPPPSLPAPSRPTHTRLALVGIRQPLEEGGAAASATPPVLWWRPWPTPWLCRGAVSPDARSGGRGPEPAGPHRPRLCCVRAEPAAGAQGPCPALPLPLLLLLGPGRVSQGPGRAAEASGQGQPLPGPGQSQRQGRSFPASGHSCENRRPHPCAVTPGPASGLSPGQTGTGGFVCAVPLSRAWPGH